MTNYLLETSLVPPWCLPGASLVLPWCLLGASSVRPTKGNTNRQNCELIAAPTPKQLFSFWEIRPEKKKFGLSQMENAKSEKAKTAKSKTDKTAKSETPKNRKV